MSDTYFWSFGFHGCGLPEAIGNSLGDIAATREAKWGDLDCGIFPDLPIRQNLCDAAFACLRGDSAHFVSGGSDEDFFSWQNSLALHDDLAMQTEQLFFPWLCQYAAQDRFFGTVSSEVGTAPSLLFAVDRACVWLHFESDKYGYPAGALAPDALKHALAEKPDEPIHDVRIDALSGTLSRMRWSDIATLFQ